MVELKKDITVVELRKLASKHGVKQTTKEGKTKKKAQLITSLKNASGSAKKTTPKKKKSTHKKSPSTKKK